MQLLSVIQYVTGNESALDGDLSLLQRSRGRTGSLR